MNGRLFKGVGVNVISDIIPDLTVYLFAMIEMFTLSDSF